MGSPEPYQVALFKDRMIPMRDGVRLAADIYRPARDGEVLPGPFPALLVRTSYDKQAEWLIDEVADCFTPKGYVLVLQDLRGRHRSEGTGQYFHTVNETAGTDGYDTVEWIAAQSWSNGRVGAMGSSHLALVQTHMALYRPPHLRAIWPDVSPTNSYAHQVRWGGAMQLHMFGALFLHAYDAQEIRDDPAARRRVLQGMERMGDWVRRTPFQPGETPLAAVPNPGKDHAGLLSPGGLRRVLAAGEQRFRAALPAPRRHPGHLQRRLVRSLRHRHHPLLRGHGPAEPVAATAGHGSLDSRGHARRIFSLRERSISAPRRPGDATATTGNVSPGSKAG